MGARIARAIAVAMAAIGGWLAVAPAVAGAWTTPVQVSPAGELTAAPRVVAGPSASATALWLQTRTVHFPTGPAPRGLVRTAERAGDGTWAAPGTLSTAGRDAWSHALAVGADGTRVAVWTEADDAGEAVRAAIAEPGQAWSGTQTIETADGTVSGPSVVVDADGLATVVWARRTGSSQWSVLASSAAAGEDEWAPPVEVQDTNADVFAAGPSVGVDEDGEVTAAWVGENQVQVATRTPAGSWSAPSPVAGGCEPGVGCDWPEAPRLAVDSDGAAIVVWRGWTGEGRRQVRAASRSAAGVWSASETLAETEAPLQALEVVGDADDATAVWSERYTMTTDSVLRSARRVAGIWQSATTLADRLTWESTQVAVAGHDDAGTVVWARSGTSVVDPPLFSATRQPDGTWGQTAPVVPGDPATFTQPAVALSAAGDSTALWVRAVSLSSAPAVYASGQAAGHVYDPPQTSLGPGAPRLTNDPTPQFDLISSQPDSTFECAMGFPGWPGWMDFRPCATPFTTQPLDDGWHLLTVRAVNAGGDTDPTPVEWQFEVDTRAPAITIARPFPNEHFAQGAVVNPVFSCVDPGDRPLRSCTASTLDTSTPGAATFTVTAVDEAGNVGEASVAYVVDAPAPPDPPDPPVVDPPVVDPPVVDPPVVDPPVVNPPVVNPPVVNPPGRGDRTDRSGRSGGGDRAGGDTRSGSGGGSGGGSQGGGGEGGSGARDGVAVPTRPSRVSANGVVSAATVSCPRARRCGISVPRHVQVAIGGRRFRVAVLAPRHVRRGARASVRLRLPRAALAQLAGRRAVARVRIVLTAPGQPRSASTVRVTLTRPA